MKTLPAGKYYIGDCCYVLEEKHRDYDLWEEFCNQFFNDSEEIIIEGKSIVAYDTLYGDGEYKSNIGASFPVDSGLIGCTPAELWKGEGNPFGCTLITFKTDFTCEDLGNGKMDFGGVIIDTNDEDYEEGEY
jgi:hypothetical protein